MANAMTCKSQVTLTVDRYREAQWEQVNDVVSIEVPVDVSWSEASAAEKGMARLWAWPEELELLALGHVLLDCRHTGHSLSRKASVAALGDRRYAVTLGSFNSMPFPLPPSSLEGNSLFKAMHAFISEGGQWDSTGCFHRTGVFDPGTGSLLARAEDIGRHNCLDRLAGWSSRTDTALTDKVLLTSARITASFCAKALRAGFRILVSRSAVTTASIALAQENGATLIGFARTGERRFTLFTDIARRMSPSLSG